MIRIIHKQFKRSPQEQKEYEEGKRWRLNRSRLLSKAPQGVTDQNFKVDCKAYKEDTPKEVLFEILNESFIENRKLQKMTREVNFTELFLGQGIRLTTADVVQNTQRKPMWKEAEKKSNPFLRRNPFCSSSGSIG